MPRYRLAIFDFDGTLANSLPWFRASFQDMIARFDLAPGGADEMAGVSGMSARPAERGGAQRTEGAAAGHRPRHAKTEARRGRRDIPVRRRCDAAVRPATP